MTELASRTRLKALALFVAFLVPVLASGQVEKSQADKRKPPKPTGNPIQPGVYRLHGSTPDLPMDDLEPLRQIVGKATVVALGESVHTSGGYYETKHRLFRFLVERMGFRAFAFESPWPDADRVARYVESCQGTPEQALRGLFGVWQGEETRDLVTWMCEWNAAHKKKDKLVFFGFDVQQPAQDGRALMDLFESRGVAPDDPRLLDLQWCDGVTSSTTYPNAIPEAYNQRCLRGLDALDATLDEWAGENREPGKGLPEAGLTRRVSLL